MQGEQPVPARSSRVPVWDVGLKAWDLRFGIQGSELQGLDIKV